MKEMSNIFPRVIGESNVSNNKIIVIIKMDIEV